MNVGQLRKLLEQADDADLVVVSGRDHNLVHTYVEYVSVLQDKDGNLLEDSGEEKTPEAKYGKRINAIQIVQL
jgi:hypothetical protein